MPIVCLIKKVFPEEIMLERKQIGVRGREGAELIVTPVCTQFDLSKKLMI